MDCAEKLRPSSVSLLFGLISYLTNNQRFSILSVGAFFIIGLALLQRVDDTSISENRVAFWSEFNAYPFFVSAFAVPVLNFLLSSGEEFTGVKCNIHLTASTLKPGAKGEIVVSFAPEEGIHINTYLAIEIRV